MCPESSCRITAGCSPARAASPSSGPPGASGAGLSSAACTPWWVASSSTCCAAWPARSQLARSPTPVEMTASRGRGGPAGGAGRPPGPGERSRIGRNLPMARLPAARCRSGPVARPRRIRSSSARPSSRKDAPSTAAASFRATSTPRVGCPVNGPRPMRRIAAYRSRSAGRGRHGPASRTEASSSGSRGLGSSRATGS